MQTYSILRQSISTRKECLYESDFSEPEKTWEGSKNKLINGFPIFHSQFLILLLSLIICVQIKI